MNWMPENIIHWWYG